MKAGVILMLQPNNIYALPDGDELVARRTNLGEYVLQDPLKDSATPPVYFVASTGRLLSWIRRSSLTARDLKPTGKLCPAGIEGMTLS